MPHGLPDWGLEGPKSTTFGLDDLGEHAVRTGSIHLYDRRGDTVVLDSFEEGLGQCEFSLSGLGAAYALEGGHACHGAFCVKLTAGSSDPWLAGVRYRRGPPVSSRLGLEFSFTLAVETNYWRWQILSHINLTRWEAAVRYDFVNNRLEVLDDTLGWHIFQNEVYLYQQKHAWHTGKMVTDLATGHYVRFLLNESVWDLSAYQSEVSVIPVAYALFWQASHIGNPDENPVAYLDSVILTQNEP